VLLANGVAQGQVPRGWAEDEALNTGVNGERFGRLVNVFDQGPGAAYAFQLWRRDLIGETAFRRALKREAWEEEWIDAIVGLKQALLSPAELANARQQGFIDAARQKDEAALQGIDAERAEIQFELSGLPPGVDVAQRAAVRGLIERPLFDQIVREGHTKTKYTGLLWEMRHPVLSAAEYATLHLKGWISVDQMYEGGALTGHTREQMDELFLARGRPAAPGQMQTAWARGVDGPDGRPMDQAQFEKGIRESDIRPEWASMLWGIRFAYPPLFQINRLVQANAIDADTALDWAHKDRYAPEVLEALGTYWRGGATAGADANVGKAQTQLWTRLHRSYIAGETDTNEAKDVLAQLGVAADAQDEILALWLVERSLAVKQLTAAQVKKAWLNAVTNPATGAPWTREDATTRLIQMGYTYNDAATFLDE
jgi:hypothetical protein